METDNIMTLQAYLEAKTNRKGIVKIETALIRRATTDLFEGINLRNRENELEKGKTADALAKLDKYKTWNKAYDGQKAEQKKVIEGLQSKLAARETDITELKKKPDVATKDDKEELKDLKRSMDKLESKYARGVEQSPEYLELKSKNVKLESMLNQSVEDMDEVKTELKSCMEILTPLRAIFNKLQKDEWKTSGKE